MEWSRRRWAFERIGADVMVVVLHVGISCDS
jgi:hypothetical protein